MYACGVGTYPSLLFGMKKDIIKTGMDNASAAIVMYLLVDVNTTITNGKELLYYKVSHPMTSEYYDELKLASYHFQIGSVHSGILTASFTAVLSGVPHRGKVPVMELNMLSISVLFVVSRRNCRRPCRVSV